MMETGEHATVVGRYAIYGEIASGGMASVHYGRLLGPVGFSRPVAIKRLHPQFGREENARAMFIDEARLAARVHHPNVVPTLDVIEEGTNLLLVMEYVRGETLAKLARACRKQKERVPVGVAVAMMTGVLNGLHAAHEATTEDGQPLHIVHRDVSSQNVIVGIDGVARVLDFGIARAAVRLESTREGIVKGKLAYMAPEQLLGTPVTRQADIFAAGIVLWELLAGRRLFLRGDEGDDSLLIAKLLRGELEPPSSAQPDLDPRLDAIVMKALDRNPAARHASAREMAQALERVGPVATQTEISAWVEHVASASLAAQAQRVSEYERSSARMRAASPVSDAVEPPTSTSSSGNRITPSLDPHVSPTLPAPAMPTGRSAGLGAGTIAVLATACAVAGASLTTAVRSAGHVQRIEPVPAPAVFPSPRRPPRSRLALRT